MIDKIIIVESVVLALVCLSLLVFTGQPLWLFLFIWNYIGSLCFLSIIDKVRRKDD